MCRVLVFSKDRPMQLHAYLESLLYFSDMREENVSVLYCHKDNISYEKVISHFPGVAWINEIAFEKQLRAWIDDSDDPFMMFGCDDVVFKGYFRLQEIEDFLEINSDVFGFSIRLGNNIEGYPNDVKVKGKYCIWEWSSNTIDNFHYPWELDCTVYRAADVNNIMVKCKTPICNPNYFEEFVELAPREYIFRRRMACYNERGKAVVITVNRVQDTHLNWVDKTLQTDPETLGYLYNHKDFRMNIEGIAKRRNTTIHVNSDYFILTPKIRSHKNRTTIGGRVKKLIKNLLFLSSIDLKNDGFFDCIKNNDAEIYSLVKDYWHPHILSCEESLRVLKDSTKSFARIGDGELDIISGKSIPFQNYNPSLQEYLIKLISGDIDDIYVGLPYFYFFPTNNLTNTVKKFNNTYGKHYREIIKRYAKPGMTYLDTVMSQIYETYVEYDFSNYFSSFKSLFVDKRVTLLIGKDIYSKYKYNLFDEAEELEIIEAPKMNAFEVAQELIDELSKRDKDRLICVSLGPTAKVIVMELTKRGYTVWDIGHLIKDYNQYRYGVPRNEKYILEFYKPD